MKYFIILAVVIGSALGNGYFEPEDHSNMTAVAEKMLKANYVAPTTCMAGFDPILFTFDNTLLAIKKPGKILMTECNLGVCKFKVTCVVMDTYFKLPGVTTPRWFDWCSISFHPHKNPTKYFRNWVVGQSLTHILERGMGYQGPIQVFTGSSTPRLFPLDGCNGADRSSWNTKVPIPACCPESEVTYRIWIDEEAEVIRFRSHCCGWAVDFYPRGLDTIIDIQVDQDHPDYSLRRMKMRGICGNMDDDYANDWRRCDTGETVTVNGPEVMEAITESCQEFDHSGLGYVGGTKISDANIQGPQ